jgi:hypothetical protein
LKNEAARSRWPGRRGQPKPSIPAGATERVTKVHESGGKATSEFWFRGRLTGRAFWDSDGALCMAVGLKDGVPVGHQLEFQDGALVYAEPFVKGLLHGTAKQFDTRGRLLLVSPFKQGTGTDFWCDERGRLSEEHPLVAGKPSGTERWWNEDQKTAYSETEWLNGEWHGATRHWTDGRLDRGFPRFFVRGKRVSKRAYLKLAARDPSLPPYRPEADSPARVLPKRVLELRQRTRRVARDGR